MKQRFTHREKGPALPGSYPEKTTTHKDTWTPVLTAARYTTAKTCKLPKCPSTGADREDVVHAHNGILLSHSEERNNGICSHMDGPRNDPAK